MKKEYDLKKMKVVGRGPIVNGKTAKVSKTIRLDFDIVKWLVAESERTRIPYQTLINHLLKECMDRSKRHENEDLEKFVNDIIEKRSNAG
jgi:uncharacterized protein (DUF4415 family)